MSGQVSEETRVGVVVGHPTVVSAVEDAGGDPEVGTARDVAAADPEVVVAVGEEGIVDLVAADVDAPVLPVAAGRGVRSVPGMAVEPAVESLVAGEFETVDHPVLVAESDGTTHRALLDLMLVTEEPARISEYAVRSGGDAVGSFRADGVVVATPAGSVGYAHAAGGPVLAPGSGVVGVVPVSPFATDQDRWVLADEGIELVVARDETPVELLVDGRSTGTVRTGDPLTVDAREALTVAIVDASYDFYGG